MLSHKYKIPGIILVLAGTVLSVIYFSTNIRFELPVLAVISSYMETRYFVTFKTNFVDESILLLLLGGFSLWVFSKEKTETEELQKLRLKALKRAILTDLVFLLFSILFIYGSTFIALVVANLILPFILYLGYYYFLMLTKGKRESLD